MEPQPVVVASHPRSGTHLMLDLLRRQFRECRAWLWPLESPHHLYLNLDALAPDHHPGITPAGARRLLSRCSRPLVKTHMLPSLDRLQPDPERAELARSIVSSATVIYMVRDGRDVMCSARAWVGQTRRESLSLSAFLRSEHRLGLDWPSYWRLHVESWLEQRVEVVRFEDVIEDPEQVLGRLATVLGLEPVWERPLLPTPNRSSSKLGDYWRRLLRDTESTAIPGRSPGDRRLDWRRDFSLEDHRLFAEAAGSCLARLGYPATAAGSPPPA